MLQQVLTISTSGRGTTDITQQVQSVVAGSNITTGMCNLFVQHTSASLIVCENASPEVHMDIETFMRRVVPDGDPSYQHDDEGPDDMAAHIRTILTQTSLSLPVTEGICALGIWQGIYLWEHRTHAHQRRIVITVS